MTKTMYVCPVCSKQIKHLKQHIARMHPEQAKTQRSHHKKPETATPATKGKKLELKTPAEIVEKPVKQGYHCVDCGGLLTKGQTPCPACGATLDWRGL